MFGVAERRVVEERADGGQAGVAGAGAVVAFLFQVVEEGPDDGGVEIGQVQLARLLAGALTHEAQDQPPGVAVGGDGVGAGVALPGQPFGEVRLEGGASALMTTPPAGGLVRMTRFTVRFRCWRSRR